MNTKSHRLLNAAAVAAALGVLTLGSAGAARADSASDVIQYGDLNTNTLTGVQTLSDRIRTVASDYCLRAVPPTYGPNDIDNARCQQAVIAEAVAKIDNPMLTRMFPAARNDEDTVRDG
ncbi:MAG TPA: UrcA family protein [Steroidobacteraceae bacterium]|nr:UrcA family protein [Steroidobacteraceae bacterium]